MVLKYFVYCFIIGAIIVSCSNTKEELAAFNKKTVQKEEIIDVKTYMSQAGVTKARLNAPLMVRYTADSTRIEFPKGLHAEFFQLDTKQNDKDSLLVESHIYADFGKYIEYSNKIFISGNVISYNAIKKDTLWCDSLWWHQDEQIIFTWGKFRFKTHDGTNMRGDGIGTGFRAKQDLSEYELFKSTGTMKAPNGAIPQ